MRSSPTLPIVLAAAYMLASLPAAHGQCTLPEGIRESPSPKQCSSSSAGENTSGPQITIETFEFEGDNHLSKADRDAIASTLSRSTFGGDVGGIAAELEERLRNAWMNHGYFNAQATCEVRLLTSTPVSQRIGVRAQVIDGPQYRLHSITFKNNKAIVDTKTLRSLFPIADGDVFSKGKIEKGLDRLRNAYRDLGYVNITSVPNTRFDDRENLVDLDIDVDEGKQFSVRSVSVLGFNDQAACGSVWKDALIMPGDIYNAKLANRFLQKLATLVPGHRPSPSDIVLRLDERAATVGVTFDLRSCPAR